MISVPTLPSADLVSRVTGRTESLFREDLGSIRQSIRTELSGSRILVIGGAGSIGSATVKLLAQFPVATLDVVDTNENTAVELIRDLRSGPVPAAAAFRTLPLDFGSPIMARFIAQEAPYDVVLNFAAVKHVRSEKDLCSSLHMIDTNVVKPARLLGWLAVRNPSIRYFSVSTDKAANPTSLMGATKRLMEAVALSTSLIPGWSGPSTSVRFANVAFSQGSLLEGFRIRLARNQPLALPRDTKRYFIAAEEAAELCVLATLGIPDRTIGFPRLDPELALKTLEAIGEAVLDHYGLTPLYVEDPAEARQALGRHPGRYPVLLTPLDTSGEKPFEEFMATGETEVLLPFGALSAITAVPLPAPLRPSLDRLAAWVHGEGFLDSASVFEEVRRMVPTFAHHASPRSLDQRM